MYEDELKEKRQERKDIEFLKSKGWKVCKNDTVSFGIYVKHPEIGMTTIERALKEYDTETD